MELFGLTLNAGNLIEIGTIIIGFIVGYTKLNLKTKVNSNEIIETNNRINTMVSDCKVCKKEVDLKIDLTKDKIFVLIKSMNDKIDATNRLLANLNATINRIAGQVLIYFQNHVNH